MIKFSNILAEIGINNPNLLMAYKVSDGVFLKIHTFFWDGGQGPGPEHFPEYYCRIFPINGDGEYYGNDITDKKFYDEMINDSRFENLGKWQNSNNAYIWGILKKRVKIENTHEHI